MVNKKIIVVIFIGLMSNVCFGSNVFKIATDLYKDQLIPLIQLNEKTIVRIHDKGSYISSFDRAEAISTLLKNLDDMGYNLTKIRVRRNKDHYFAMVDNIKIFDVTTGDAIANNTTPYALAKEWVNNIIIAAKASSSGITDPSPEVNALGSAEDSLLIQNNFLENSSGIPFRFVKGIFNIHISGTFQILLMIISIQLLATFFTIWLMNKKYRKQNANSILASAKFDEIQNTISFLMKEAETLSSQIFMDLESKSARLKKLLEQADFTMKRINENRHQSSLSALPVEPAPGSKKTFSNALSYRRELIQQLKQQGKPLIAIAKELNIGIGEVSLALNLSQNRDSKDLT